MRILMASLAVALVLAAPAAAQESFDSGDIAVGESWSMTFTEVNEGGYTYHCHPHPWMTGMVHVFAEGTFTTHEPGVNTFELTINDNGDITNQTAMTYSTEHLSVEVGDTVTWTNEGTFVHTVTEGGDDDDHMHHDDDHMDDHMHDGVDTPGFGMLALIASLGLVAYARRR